LRDDVGLRDDACVEIEESKNVSCWLSSSSVQLGPCPLIEVGRVIMDANLVFFGQTKRRRPQDSRGSP